MTNSEMKFIRPFLFVGVSLLLLVIVPPVLLYRVITTGTVKAKAKETDRQRLERKNDLI